MGNEGRGFKLYPVPGVILSFLPGSLDWWSTWFGCLEAAVASGSMTVLRKSLISLAESLTASCWPCSMWFWRKVKVGMQVRKQLLRDIFISLSDDSRRWQKRTFPLIFVATTMMHSFHFTGYQHAYQGRFSQSNMEALKLNILIFSFESELTSQT